MGRKRGDGGLVYSSEGGRMCPDCDQPVAECRCSSARAQAPSGPVRIRLETKGRKGKAVTVVTGLPLDPLELADLGKRLKNRCGAGGTVKDGAVEIQGDHREVVRKVLEAEGFKPR
jgi:translation initiation factor 1